MAIRKLLVFVPLVAALLLGALFSVAPASADSATLGIDHNGGAPDINPGPAIAVAGGTAKVSLIVKAPATLGAWTINVHYNSAVLDTPACTAALLPHLANECNPNYPGDIVRLAGAEIDGVAGTFNLMDMTFHAVGPAGSCSSLTIEVEFLTDPLAVPLTPVISNGSICIVACADITGDGRVDGRDVVRFLLHLLFRRPFDPAFDLNGDGRVNLADLFIAAGQLGKTC